MGGEVFPSMEDSSWGAGIVSAVPSVSPWAALSKKTQSLKQVSTKTQTPSISQNSLPGQSKSLLHWTKNPTKQPDPRTPRLPAAHKESRRVSFRDPAKIKPPRDL